MLACTRSESVQAVGMSRSTVKKNMRELREQEIVSDAE